MTLYTVTFKADNGLAVTVLAGDGAPMLSGGFGGWETVDRPRRVGITRFKGRSPMSQDIPIRFSDPDGEDVSQEQDITTLMRMASQGADLAEPPKIRLGGIAWRKDLTWVINDITWDSTAQLITVGSTPVRVRQDAVVHLLQYVDDTVLTTAASPAANAQTPKKKAQVTVPDGMTLKQVAGIEYPGQVDKGMNLLIWANEFLSADPRAIIPTGTVLSIPDINAPGIDATKFIIPG